MARRTEWVEYTADVYHGVGQRVLATDVDEFPLLEVREISLGASDVDASAAAD